ncbi:HET-domain-containing protein [Neurospora crassa]|uniref:Serine/threonine protein kinase-44 n=1 Tax=Neurospora crassa (strain ATCC 24698 / 74-OR23-1A / CBS 708.71 / DSM 1257 / FGSC 987) TaxID=367110 RepID=Q7S8N1_NEUCR|nr:serine/threonine protein kinase-44 [Neurospora crassa OR74A]EAA32707.3 serine/threonine protein kinase-44 [Neurospora crassa OR74A]KHE84038.1 HET-domain-containing protein [Neurospora crassa]|eukprot:XP_961943.3 serine/threonine protein kinase-44 [Neurospora crassa OR74A]
MDQSTASTRKRQRSFSETDPHSLATSVVGLALRPTYKRLRLDDNYVDHLGSQAANAEEGLRYSFSGNLNHTHYPAISVSDASGMNDNGMGSSDSEPDDASLYEELEVKGLSDQIQNSLVRSPLQYGRVFLPEGVLDKLLTKDAVRHELLRNEIYLDPPKLDTMVDFIVPGARKLFATALLTGLDYKKLHAALNEFLRKPIDDSSLPLDEQKLDDLLEKKRGKPIWRTDVNINAFLTQQWAFLAPTFPPPPGPHVMEVWGHTVLPFIDRNEIVDDVGAFGAVYEVTPHEANITDVGLKGSRIAVKRLKFQQSKDTPERREGEVAWIKEVKIHHEIAQMNHPHIIDFICAIHGVIIDRGPEHLLLFRWADQGNLNSFWRSHPNPRVSASLVQEIMIQFQGLTEALYKLHTPGKKGSYRHSDIKPDNILSFSTPGRMSSDEHPDIGTLKLSDLGLAKYHVEATGYRHQTSAKYTTHRYQAPEAVTDEDGARSTRYDIWSMGCVMLEFVIWLLYGNETLKRFNVQITTKSSGSWFMKKGQTAKLHDTVAQTMNFMLESDPECQDGTAVGELIRLVKERLLVVHLGPDTKKLQRVETFKGVDSTVNDIPSIQVEQIEDGFVSQRGDMDTRIAQNLSAVGRATSEELFGAMKRIVSIGKESQHYWCTGQGDRAQITQELLKVLSTTNRTRPSRGDSFLAPPSAGGIGNNGGLLPPRETRREPQVLDIPDIVLPSTQTKRGFQIEDTWGDLRRNQETCEFCALRWDLEDTVKIGLPGLTVSEDQHFALLRGWLRYCDTHHECKPWPGAPLPTRVLDLGTMDDTTIRLRETQKGDSFRYIALSHCWGKHEHFFTTALNRRDHMRGIHVDNLPKTFQHAVKTTRGLGIRYLWIDSMCIIQGPGGDFDKQSAKMEDVFSSAYCVIAASSARGQGDGFLNPRRKCDHVKVVNESAKGAVYVSRFRDDFKEHVLNSPLSERGWVLQERALARRTIYFTEWQTYWECGDGIRCESLTRMDNKLISYLGDPNFPSKLSGAGSNRGEKIRFYEDLYRHYSRLNLTWKKDRPVAIAALERRLHRDLKSSGEFGVFDDSRSLLPRSLLWQRGAEVTSLNKISFPPDTHTRLPTWSWMAYDGGIDFLDLPLGEVDWDVSEIQGNWTIHQTLDIQRGPQQQEVKETELSAKTRRFKMGTTGSREFDIIYDIPNQVSKETALLKCVLVGKLRNNDVPKEKTTYYVLVVVLRDSSLPTEMYERVGVGRMLGEYIDLDNSQPGNWVKIR